jgi:hypothetical protein
MTDAQFRSEDDLVACLDDIDRNRDFAGDTDEAYSRSYQARERLHGAVGAMQDNSALVTDRTINSLTLIALHSPFADISDDPPHHRQNFQQDVSLTAVRELPGIAIAVPDATENVIKALATVASDSRDWDLRREALGMLYVMGGWDGTSAPAVAALKKQAASNDNPIIRILARDNIQSIATQWRPDVVPAALEAQQQGTADPNDEARQRAYGMLGNMVKSIAELDEPTLNTLAETFNRAVAADKYEGVRNMATLCLQDTEERLKRAGMTPIHPVLRR